MYCSNCGKALVASAKFCSNCGAMAIPPERSGVDSNAARAEKSSRLNLKPLHYPFSGAIGFAFLGWLANKPWGEEMAGVVGTAFLLGLVVALGEIAFKYFRKQ